MALIINGLRFACEGCIRGHRSANCNHKDRQLKEIKPRGRPLSQCKTCRDNRKNLGKHSKCYCGDDCKGKELDPQVDERSEVGESREGEGKVGEGSASASGKELDCKCNSNGPCICCSSKRKKPSKSDPPSSSSISKAFDNPIKKKRIPKKKSTKERDESEGEPTSWGQIMPSTFNDPSNFLELGLPDLPTPSHPNYFEESLNSVSNLRTSDDYPTLFTDIKDPSTSSFSPTFSSPPSPAPIPQASNPDVNPFQIFMQESGMEINVSCTCQEGCKCPGCFGNKSKDADGENPNLNGKVKVQDNLQGSSDQLFGNQSNQDGSEGYNLQNSFAIWNFEGKSREKEKGEGAPLECPTRCSTCLGCDLSLENPWCGIPEVDEFMNRGRGFQLSC